MKSNPFISIIIAVYNASDLIERTMQNIQQQGYSDFELIIIDGGSSDNTGALIEPYLSTLVDHYISEPDKGIYDAWNKGIKAAKGEWICFLGAGDEFLPNALENYTTFIRNIDTGTTYLVSSMLHIVNINGKNLYDRGSAWNWTIFKKYMNIAHPGAMHHKTLFRDYGLFDSHYKIAGDYELLMRAGAHLHALFMPIYTVKMLEGGMSSGFKILKEVYRLKTQTAGIPVTIAYLDYLIALTKLKIRNIFYHFGIYLTLRNKASGK